MERAEVELVEAARDIETELRKMRSAQLPLEERQKAARMIGNLGQVAAGILARSPELASPHG